MNKRIFLALLLCFTFVQSQTFALVGGPNYGSTTNLIGSYSGILQVDATTSVGENAIGLFTLSVPQTGLASGDVFIFQNGLFFQGTILGAQTSSGQSLKGVIEAYQRPRKSGQNDVILITFYGSTSSIAGQINASVTSAERFSLYPRLQGTASCDMTTVTTGYSITSGTSGSTGGITTSSTTETVNYIIDGIKQSNSPNTSTTTTGATGG